MRFFYLIRIHYRAKDTMTAKVYNEETRAAILGTILTNPNASIRTIESLLNAQGYDISRHMISDYKIRAKELVYGLSIKNVDNDDVIQKPVVQTGLVEAATRINELNEIYYRLKDELNNGGLWTERIHTDMKGGTSSEFLFNGDLIREMRGCLNDIAKEVGGRSTRAIIEHRNADTGSVDIHAMILNVQRAAEAKQNLPPAPPPTELMPPGSEKASDTVLDLPAEEAFIDQFEGNDDGLREIT